MKQSYLLDIIQALSEEERVSFALFLQSPYFQARASAKDLLSLYHIILEAAPDFSEEQLDKRNLYERVFPGTAAIPGKLEKLMSELTRNLKQFALWERYNADSNELQTQLDWVAWLRERGMEKRFHQAISKMINQEKEQSEESLKSYQTSLALSKELHEWESEHNQFRSDLNLSDLIQSLDAYYFNYRTELVNRYLTQQKGAQLPNLEWMEASIDIHQQSSLLLNITLKIQAYLRKDMLLTEEFEELLALIRNNEKSLSFLMKSQLYAYLRNMGSFLINSGHLNLIPIIHEVHQENLAAGYLTWDNKIQPTYYLNLVQIATRAGQYTWAQEFTEAYKDRIIGGDENSNFYKLNIATCLFAAGKWEQALEQVPQIPSSSHYHMMERLLELKILFELQSDLLEYKIFAFRKYIERTAPKAISALFREMNLNFLNMLIQIIQSPARDKKRSERLVERIQSKKAISERGWLIEKAKALA
ncbi:MAG TPA: hypothetical protein VK168_03280 [Saprospiraceae bacterium]|nr:hypothetical protein [Saprospiraceae bacterium]